MIDVWDINVPVLELFLSVQSQWRVQTVAWGGFIRSLRHGLDYSAVDVVMRRLDIDNALFADLQVMESAALDVFGGLA